MKELKMNSRSKSSGQILAVVIIVLALIGGGFWWLFTNKQAMAKEGREFGREAIQRIAVQHDLAFFPARGAEINIAISHPVGRWQIDDVAFTPDPER